MDAVGKGLTTVAIVLAMIAWCVSLTFLSERHSLLYLATTAIVVLPVASWFGLRNEMALNCACVAVLLALSPVDYTMQKTGTRGLRLLPVSHGMVCQPDTACYGCIVGLNPPAMAVVLSF